MMIGGGGTRGANTKDEVQEESSLKQVDALSSPHKVESLSVKTDIDPLVKIHFCTSGKQTFARIVDK